MAETPEEPVGPADPAVPVDPVEDHDDSGLELARAIARGLAGRTPAQGARGLGRSPGRGRRRPVVEPRVSGARPDDRDPQTVDASLGRFVAEQGWASELRVHGVFARWEAIVGREVGQHVRPETLSDGRLSVRTDSTAWATQMRLLAPDVVRRLNEVLGDGTVTVIDVAGPRGPSWTRGRLRVKGRGPRDTYG
ncbi:Predicted nucleic acid-binding protein, contains Zn-ribbon domain (includes truncated derivatives) [Nocardioides scoriae]|uniref:Predicted nucleic acid-binding protein, contains Zn-ribbon domain (Includes truncated derivatives) n=1 Tax=Nocardioides scoriae TaxID=642780 RepID=A0A1H1VQT9_9ACTN|nr:DciA family protein [Nocardioides scoriae]SDS87045.1 Predicted nucleic acid-binding protein, contains Zn-ribbon domain (includes truncated derivatives) [Nocardioides scoriae]